MPTTPFAAIPRNRAGQGNLDNVSTIAVCDPQPEVDICRMRIVQPDPENTMVGCFDTSIPYTFDTDNMWDPDTTEFNLSLPYLIQQGYNAVCRAGSVSMYNGKFTLFLSKGEEIPGIPFAPQADDAATTPIAAIFTPCDPALGDNNGSKAPLPIMMTPAEAQYLAGQFASTDHFTGCSIRAEGDKVYFWLTHNPDIINQAIGKIRNDIIMTLRQAGFPIPAGMSAEEALSWTSSNPPLPSGVTARQALAMIEALNDVKAQNPASLAQLQIDFMKENFWKQILFGFLMSAIPTGVMGYFFYQQLKVSRQMLAQNQKLMEDRFGVARNPLEEYGRDLRARFREGLLRPLDLSFRADQMELTRTALIARKSVAYTGDRGVGKTSQARALAIGIEQGLYPELANTYIIELDLNRMVAGTGHRGDFEKRLQAVLDEVIGSEQRSGKRYVLFIDEFHRLIGAGSAEGIMGADQTLKPPLADGEIVVIGATTSDEFAYIISDPALEDRFLEIGLRQPSADETVGMLRGILSEFGKADTTFPEMRVTEEALREAVRLADQYLTDKTFPRKAAELLRQAVANKRLHCANAGDMSTATELTAQDVRQYFERVYRDRMSRGPRGPNDPNPPGAVGTGGMRMPPPPPGRRSRGAQYAITADIIPGIVVPQLPHEVAAPIYARAGNFFRSFGFGDVSFLVPDAVPIPAMATNNGLVAWTNNGLNFRVADLAPSVEPQVPVGQSSDVTFNVRLPASTSTTTTPTMAEVVTSTVGGALFGGILGIVNQGVRNVVPREHQEYVPYIEGPIDMAGAYGLYYWASTAGGMAPQAVSMSFAEALPGITAAAPMAHLLASAGLDQLERSGVHMSAETRAVAEGAGTGALIGTALAYGSQYITAATGPYGLAAATLTNVVYYVGNNPEQAKSDAQSFMAAVNDGFNTIVEGTLGPEAVHSCNAAARSPYNPFNVVVDTASDGYDLFNDTSQFLFGWIFD